MEEVQPYFEKFDKTYWTSREQLSVFSAPANNWVVKITRFQFRGGLVNNKHTMIYSDLDPSLEVIALCLAE
jgi:hypothetical protein